MDNLRVVERFFDKNPDFARNNNNLLRKIYGRIFRKYGEDLVWRRQYRLGRNMLIKSMGYDLKLSAFYILLKSFVYQTLTRRTSR
jgi:hypothetical protein